MNRTKPVVGSPPSQVHFFHNLSTDSYYSSTGRFISFTLQCIQMPSSDFHALQIVFQFFFPVSSTSVGVNELDFKNSAVLQYARAPSTLTHAHKNTSGN